MNLEVVILWVAVATLVAAVGAVIVTFVYGEIDRRLARRQLALAQEQAAMRPVLEVESLSMLDLEDAEGLWYKVREASDFWGEVGVAEEHPEYPMPNKVVRVVLVNSGRTAAYEVTGWVTFDPNFFESVAAFGDGTLQEGSNEEEVLRVQVGGGKEDNLLPTSSDYRIYDIAVKARSVGTTSVGYEFVSRIGKDVEGSRDIEIPST